MSGQFRVTKTLEGRHPLHESYPLLPGDIISRDSDGGWMKHAPGLGLFGFILTEDDVTGLEPADDAKWVIS